MSSKLSSLDINTGLDLRAEIEHLSHDQKWEILKPELEILFHFLDLRYAEIAQFMTEKYGFNAHIPHYKYRFRGWKWNRNVSSNRKEQILKFAQQYNRTGKRPADAFDTTGMDPKKLMRYVKTNQQEQLKSSTFHSFEHVQTHDPEFYSAFGLRPLSSWNILSSALLYQNIVPLASPIIPYHHTPTDADESGSTIHASSRYQVRRALSPVSQVLALDASITNTNLFLQGQFQDLVRDISPSQMSSIAQWFHKYWMFAFRQARSWGSDSLQGRLNELGMLPSPADSPSLLSTKASSSFVNKDSVPRLRTKIEDPSDLCDSAIHLSNEESEIFSFEITEPSLENQLQQSMEHTTFDWPGSEPLSISPSQIGVALSKSSQTLLEETLAFAIMASNMYILTSLKRSHCAQEIGRALHSIHAAHIATSYMNGGKDCCNTLGWVLSRMNVMDRACSVNVHGHTVLDNIMITILKNHSTSSIRNIDQSLKSQAEYTGIEVDVCGRWDADSDAYRSLLATGRTSIPVHWKHKFCNTSVQVVCHSIHELMIMAVGFRESRPDRSSGLFLKLCTSCGARLCPTPLHTLILTGFELANHSRPGEDLFGIIACLLCMLSWGFDPCETADISVSSLLNYHTMVDTCDHQEMTADELIRSLTSHSIEPWSPELKTGWNLLLHICERAKLSRMVWTTRKQEYFSTMFPKREAGKPVADGADDFMKGLIDRQFRQEMVDEFTEAGFCFPKICSCSQTDERWPVFGTDKVLPHLWVSVQAEFLTYRRSSKHEPWLSPNFDMKQILHNLEAGRSPDTGYMVQGLLKPYCWCGHAGNPFHPPTRSGFFKSRFANIYCQKRTSFIPLKHWDY